MSAMWWVCDGGANIYKKREECETSISSISVSKQQASANQQQHTQRDQNESEQEKLPNSSVQKVVFYWTD